MQLMELSKERRRRSSSTYVLVQYLRESGPLTILQIPNAPYSFYSNFSTYDGEYTQSDIDGILNNGLDIITNGNSTAFRTCIGCAMIQRGLDRGNITQPAACAQCFSEYCWNGQVNNTTPSTSLLAPSLTAAQVISGSGAASSSKATSSSTSSASATAKSSASKAIDGSFGIVPLSLGVVAVVIGMCTL